LAHGMFHTASICHCPPSRTLRAEHRVAPCITIMPVDALGETRRLVVVGRGNAPACRKRRWAGRPVQPNGAGDRPASPRCPSYDTVTRARARSSQPRYIPCRKAAPSATTARGPSRHEPRMGYEMSVPRVRTMWMQNRSRLTYQVITMPQNCPRMRSAGGGVEREGGTVPPLMNAGRAAHRRVVSMEPGRTPIRG